MNKENGIGAAGLRRSAIAERIRLREEWSALKEVDPQPMANQNRNVKKGPRGPDSMFLRPIVPKCGQNTSIPSNCVLCGVVSLVEVGAESRALPLRAALAALGASVLPAWSPLVTHLVWAQGGCRSTRAKARALASFVVSPLWVEACASAERRLPERTFPAASRPSDLPSPKTLTRLLKKAEMENIPIADLLSESPDKEQKMPRLRISSETEHETDTSRDTSHDTSRDTSRDTSKDTSCDKSNDTTDIESRVNTAPRSRRAKPQTPDSSSPKPKKSKRKLFTQKEGDMLSGNEENRVRSKKATQAPTQVRGDAGRRRELARAERLARKILAECRGDAPSTPAVNRNRFRIVLTGMSGEERRATTLAIRSLKGKIQADVDARTTHVLLGSCVRHDDIGCPSESLTPRPRTVKALRGAARGVRVLHAKWALDSAESKRWLHPAGYEVPHLKKLSLKARVERSALGKQRSEYAYDVFNGMRVSVSETAVQRDAAIELLNMCGAVVVPDKNHSNDGGNDLNHGGNDLNLGGNDLIPGVTQLNRSRTQHNRNKTQINGRTHLNRGGTQLNRGGTQLNRDGTQLNRGGTQLNRGGTQLNQQNELQQEFQSEYDVRVGDKNGEISSKWVFDSVASARMRTTRRYIVNSLSNNDEVSQILTGC